MDDIEAIMFYNICLVYYLTLAPMYISNLCTCEYAYVYTHTYIYLPTYTKPTHVFLEQTIFELMFLLFLLIDV